MSSFQASRLLDAIATLDRINTDDDTASLEANAHIDHVLASIPYGEIECALREKESALHDAVTVALFRWRPEGRPN